MEWCGRDKMNWCGRGKMEWCGRGKMKCCGGSLLVCLVGTCVPPPPRLAPLVKFCSHSRSVHSPACSKESCLR